MELEDELTSIVEVYCFLIVFGPSQWRVCFLILEIVNDFVELIKLILIRFEFLNAFISTAWNLLFLTDFFPHTIKRFFQSLFLQMVHYYLPHDFLVEVCYWFLLFGFIFISVVVERVVEILTLNFNAFLNGLTEFSYTFKILLITVHHIFESLLCLLHCFGEAYIGLFFG